jgi:cob(I)alamin adenosyltransferase
MAERSAKVTTRTGDDGYTGLLGAGRVPKWDPRMETIGTIDEATSALGLARAQVTATDLADAIHALQRDLYLLMGELATPPENYEQMGLRVTAAHVAKLDTTLEEFRARVQIGNQFIIPGATVAGAALDLARTIVRRGERDACAPPPRWHDCQRRSPPLPQSRLGPPLHPRARRGGWAERPDEIALSK